jgi:hypothetical protein
VKLTILSEVARVVGLVAVAIFATPVLAGTFTDDFNRSDEDPLASNGWSTADGRCEMEILSNAVGWDDNNTDCLALYDTVTNARCISAVMSTLPSSGGANALYLVLNATEGQTGTTTDYYGVRFTVHATLEDIHLFRFDNGSFVDISGSGGSYQGGATPFVINDVMQVCRDGSEIVVTQNGVERIRKAETTYTSGKAGLGAFTSNSTFTPRWDNAVITYGVPIAILVPPRRTQ